MLKAEAAERAAAAGAVRGATALAEAEAGAARAVTAGDAARAGRAVAAAPGDAATPGDAVREAARAAAAGAGPAADLRAEETLRPHHLFRRLLSLRPSNDSPTTMCRR